MKEKKSFYEQCQNRPADYEENPDKYKDTPYGMFRNSMKKFDEVNNILVDVSWLFTIVIINLTVFIVIFSCLISAIRSYNKNVELERQLQINWEINKSAVINGLRSEGILGNYETVNGYELKNAITNKNIIIRDNKADFAKIPGFNPRDYGNIYYEGKDCLGNPHWFCIKIEYLERLKHYTIMPKIY